MKTPTFSRAVAAIENVYTFFEQYFQEGQLEPLDVIRCGSASGPTTIEVSNRYLTPRKDAPDMQSIKPGKGVDPEGLLERVMGEGTHVHGEDNSVEYYACGSTREGERRY